VDVASSLCLCAVQQQVLVGDEVDIAGGLQAAGLGECLCASTGLIAITRTNAATGVA